MKNEALQYFTAAGMTPRDEQTFVIDEVAKNWNDYKYFILDCPTGTGKTHLAISISSTVENSYILTSTKMLQDQYLKSSPMVTSLKGKGNYTCDVEPMFTADAAPCLAQKSLLKQCQSANRCPYYNARNKAFSSHMFLTNYTYFMFATHCGPLSENGPYKDKRERSLLVMDEAHELENHLVGFAEIRITKKRLAKLGVEVNDLDWQKEDEYELTIELFSRIKRICDEYEIEINEQLNKSSGVQDDLHKLKLEFAKNINGLRNKHYALDKYLQSYKIFSARNKEDKWVFELNRKEEELVISPITTAGLFGKYVDGSAEKFIFMSATMPPAAEMAKLIGCEESEICTVSTDSPFPAEKSPITIFPAVKTSFKALDENLPFITEICTKITDSYQNEKGIIHTGNYKIANYIYKNAPDRLKKRLLYKNMLGNDADLNNQELLEMHSSRNDGTILLSPSMTTGVDLENDLSRFQLMVKLPFLSLGDIRVKTKADLDDMWYQTQMWMTILQSAGRSTRSVDDYCHSYIIDSSFPYFYGKFKNKLPDHFTKRLVMS